MAATRRFRQFFYLRCARNFGSSKNLSVYTGRTGMHRTFQVLHSSQPRMHPPGTSSRPPVHNTHTDPFRSPYTTSLCLSFLQLTYQNLSSLNFTFHFLSMYIDILPLRNVVISARSGCWYRICTSLVNLICALRSILFSFCHSRTSLRSKLIASSWGREVPRLGEISRLGF